LARKVYKKPIKRHYRDNIQYLDILTHDRHYLVSPASAAVQGSLDIY